MIAVAVQVKPEITPTQALTSEMRFFRALITSIKFSLHFLVKLIWEIGKNVNKSQFDGIISENTRIIFFKRELASRASTSLYFLLLAISLNLDRIVLRPNCL